MLAAPRLIVDCGPISQAVEEFPECGDQLQRRARHRLHELDMTSAHIRGKSSRHYTGGGGGGGSASGEDQPQAPVMWPSDKGEGGGAAVRGSRAGSVWGVRESSGIHVTPVAAVERATTQRKTAKWADVDQNQSFEEIQPLRRVDPTRGRTQHNPPLRGPATH